MTDRAATPWDEAAAALAQWMYEQHPHVVERHQEVVLSICEEDAEIATRGLREAGYSLAGPDQLVVPRTPDALDTLVEHGLARRIDRFPLGPGAFLYGPLEETQ